MAEIKKYVEVDGKFYQLVKHPNWRTCNGCSFLRNDNCVGNCNDDYYYQPVGFTPTKMESEKDIARFLLNQNLDTLKEFVADMVFCAHKAEYQDVLSQEEYVIERLKKIAEDN